MAAPHASAGETAGAAGSDQTLYGSRAIRDLYPGLREDRLRYLERWGVIRPVTVSGGERFYAFALYDCDDATVRSHLLTQPTCDGSPAGPDLEAPPA